MSIPNPNLPSYADPDFEPTVVRNHNPEWNHPAGNVLELGGYEDVFSEESEQDQGTADQVFEGAGIPLANNLTVDRRAKRQGPDF